MTVNQAPKVNAKASTGEVTVKANKGIRFSVRSAAKAESFAV